MTDDPVVSAQWLSLREPADAAARATDLVEQLRPRLADATLTMHDLGCGSGGMGRWLAPQLPGPQRWVLYDRDPALLAVAAAAPGTAADGTPVTVETRRRDITRLDPAELAGAALVTASALLDMFTREELDRFVGTCVAAGAPVLVTLSVVGRVELTPGDPLDAPLAAAFDAHQRRTTGGRRLLGPDAAEEAAGAFRQRGADVRVADSPWRLGPDQTALTAEWLTGWLAAAVEQQPDLASPATDWARRRLAEAAAGRLTVTVGHQDLLVLP